MKVLINWPNGDNRIVDVDPEDTNGIYYGTIPMGQAVKEVGTENWIPIKYCSKLE